LNAVGESFEYDSMKTLRKSFSRFLCIFCAGILLPLLLGGCSYFDTGEDERLQTGKPGGAIEVVDQSAYAPEPISVAEAISRHTDGRVQVFDLDEPVAGALYYEPVYDSAAVQPAAVIPVDYEPAPRVYAANPSVEIFPFEDFAPLANSPAHAAPPPPVEQVMREEDYVALEGHDGDKVIVYFGHDSAALSLEAQGKVASVASQFNEASGQGITVEGHSSVKANYEGAAQRKIVNLKISMNRAFAVARGLIENGVPADFIRVMAWGDVRPPLQVDGKTPEEAARRVEISR
jgi:outer membrane protein OmpA-like peptidoglycan-associated protein